MCNWRPDPLIPQLRTQHKFKRRLQEELDTLENQEKKNQRILDD